ncbi:MAG: hypothetical protein IT377_25320 [Polyangiaceae bacterium]|nr:hypothetical protein [Polyangiaceae bacterium]
MKGVAFLALAATLLVHETARAEPQWNASALTGVCGRGTGGSYFDDTCWYNGVRADVLFGRDRYSDVSAGPFLGVTTAGFDDLRIGGGATLLLPVTQYFPLGLSGGAHARNADGSWTPGVSGWLFFGSRSYNFHSRYVMAGGLLFGVEHDLRRPDQNAVVIAAQIDGLVLALPFVLGYEWLAGRNEDDD